MAAEARRDRDNQTPRAEADRRVGLLLVHGMGEQESGEFTDKVVRNLITSWSSDFEVRETIAGPSDPCPDCARDSPCKCPESARLVLRVGVNGKLVDLHCHEVWWADLGQRTGFRNWLRFLWWTALVPFRRRQRNPRKPAEKKRAQNAGLVKPDSNRTGIRGVWQFFILLASALLALLTVFTWGAVRRVMRKFAPSPVTLLQSFGDVQAYQEAGRPESGSGNDMGLPPRFAIRRRMVEEMVAMAERNYDNWYVLAHSLGSVIAFNGLMEPDYILPNYISAAQWDRLDEFKSKRKSDDIKGMRPRRPSWLCNTDALSRKKIFADLKGLVTYGSPLHLFADLWPHTVAVNTCRVFSKNFKWFNIHSPLDPFSGSLARYGATAEREEIPALEPKSLVFSGSCMAFVAHAHYMDSKADGDSLSRSLGPLVLLGQGLQLPKRWQAPLYASVYLQSAFVAALTSAVAWAEASGLLRLLCGREILPLPRLSCPSAGEAFVAIFSVESLFVLATLGPVAAGAGAVAFALACD